jgi:integrase
MLLSREVVARAADPNLGRWREQVAQTGYCARPVRLRGQLHQFDVQTGELREVYSTDHEPDGVLLKACGNRRASRCPQCSETYRRDAFHVVASGLRGGKGIPDTVRTHPCVFATFTAPSFGPVHARRERHGRVRPCRPRHAQATCPHGRPLWCFARHQPDDPALGRPLCAKCFDAEALVLWTILACRSLLNRILKAAVKDRRLAFNPVREVDPPPRPVDADQRLGNAKRRTFSPAEFGRFLTACPEFYRGHFVTQIGTGLRPGELLGLPPRRARPADGLIEVVEVRYDAGRFGAGYKKRPKSAASIRQVPLPKQVAEAIADALVDCPPDGRVFAGPGGNRHARRGERTALSVNNYRRVYKRTVANAQGLDHLELRGPHDLRHTYATWLEEAGIPSRVIDELMGHSGGGGPHEGSPMAKIYRHTTPEMLARVVAAIDERLAVALGVAQMWPDDGQPERAT